MRTNIHSAKSVLPILFALLLPTVTAAQEVLDLPGQDRPLAIEEEEIFSVGSMAGEEWETFARVEGVAFDAEGNLYILDAQNSRVVKVGPQGQFSAELGRAGEGPGEFGRPLAISVTRSGEVRVFDLNHQGFTVFNPDGSFKSTARIAGGFFVPNGGLMSLPNGGMVDGGMSAGKMQVMTSGDGENQIAPRPVNLFALSDEAEITTAFEAWNPLSAVGNQREETFSGGGIQMTGATMRAFDAGLFVGAFPDGRLAVADSTTYTVKVVDPGQGVTRILQRPFTPREVTRRDQTAERNRQLAQIAGREESSGGGRAYSSDGSGSGSIAISSGRVSDLLRARVETMEFGDEIPVLAGMAVDWSGRIWIERTGQRVGERGPIDLIDTEGSYVGSVAPENFRIPDAFGPNGLAAYIETDEMDVPRVVVRRLKVG